MRNVVNVGRAWRTPALETLKALEKSSIVENSDGLQSSQHLRNHYIDQCAPCGTLPEITEKPIQCKPQRLLSMDYTFILPQCHLAQSSDTLLADDRFRMGPRSPLQNTNWGL